MNVYVVVILVIMEMRNISSLQQKYELEVVILVIMEMRNIRDVL